MDEETDDQVDSTLPPEWALPELPKVLTPTLSTAEFEDIFGGSDEEGNFPLSVGGLQGHMDLDTVLPNPGELFNTSISESLNMETKESSPMDTDNNMEIDSTDQTTERTTSTEQQQQPLTSDQPPVSSSSDKEEMTIEEKEPVSDTTEANPQLDSITTTPDAPDAVTTVDNNIPIANNISVEMEQQDGGGDEEKIVIEEESKQESVAITTTTITSRRSARIRAREEQSLMVAENVTIKSDGTSKEGEEFDEESLVDSLLEKNNEIFQQKDSGDDDPPSSSGATNPTATSTQSQEEGDDDVDEEEEADVCSGDEDSDDPDKLWCICQQPHNDRFMICCDSCGEWYHGDCVGISVTEGKKMEKTGQEYVCSKCVEREHSLKAEREKNRSLRLAKREQIREKQIAELHGKKPSEEVADSQETRDDDLFYPDNAGEKDMANLKKKKKLRIRDVVKKPCLGPGCEKVAVRPCLYCSDTCIEKHCEFSLKKLSVRGLMPNKGEGGVTLYEPSTKKMLTGISAPAEKDLLPFIKEHQSYKVFVPSQKVLPAAKKPVKKSRRESDVKDEQVPDSSSGSKLNLDAESIRGHARKALKQVLLARSQSIADIDKSESEITELANDIELKLYNLYNQEVTQKYKSKCRSLLFNLKDTKNQVLFRKIVSGDLTSRQLVRMTPDQLASEELAEWREKTIKKELEMIKEVAIEEAQMSSSGVIRKMTYKGEVEIERQSEIEVAPVDNKPDEVSSTTPELPVTSDAPAPPKVTPTVKVKSEYKSSSTESKESSLLDILTNTTPQHGSHVFDQNCDICTGREKAGGGPPTLELSTATETSCDLPSPDSRTIDSELSVTEVTSPDPIHTFTDTSIPDPLHPLLPLWSGTMSMHGLETTTVVAYPVSGPVNEIDVANTFPESLLIVGRIAHVQVWDYIDKLRSSVSKEIVVLRFDCVESDRNSYLNLMDYLIHKHRYGVIRCSSINGVKDMYLVPLQYDDPPPPHIFPFNGPGLPDNRTDTFLCIMTKVKHHHHPVTPDTPRKRKLSSRVHFSTGTPPSDIPLKKSRVQAVIGFGDTTPPMAPPTTDPEQVSPSPTQQDESTVNPDQQSKHKPFFYRETEFEEPPTKKEPSSENIDPVKLNRPSPTQPSTGTNIGTGTGTNVKSILSTLSEEKIKELASAAMSSLNSPSTQTPPHKASTPPVALKDVKTEISIPAESTSLMKGSLPKYSISTAELVTKDEHPSPHSLSLDERLQATFGRDGDSQRPDGGPNSGDPRPMNHPQPYSNYPHSHPPPYHSPNRPPFPSPHDQGHGGGGGPSMHQQTHAHQSIDPRGPPRHHHASPSGPHPSNIRPDFNSYHSSPHSYRSQYDHHPPQHPNQPSPPGSSHHPPLGRHHSADYRYSNSEYGPPPTHRGRYDYNRDNDYHRNSRDDKGDYNIDRRGRHDGGSGRGGGNNWRGNRNNNPDGNYRDNRMPGAAHHGPHRSSRDERTAGSAGGNSGWNRHPSNTNEDYGR